MLASALDGPVTAVDLLPEMIEGLHRRMETEGRTEQVTGIVASMLSLPFAEASFDLLWAEGSIYNIGFEKGLTQWRRFLKPDGFIAITECSWLSSARPDEMVFFRDNFPEIDDISGKIRCMERAGYRPVAHFILPDSCWTENYYATGSRPRTGISRNLRRRPSRPTFRRTIGRGDRAVPSLRPSLRLCLLHRATDRVIRMHTHSEGRATDVAGPRSVRPLPVDHPRTNQRLPVVPDGELAGRDAPLGLVEKQIPALVAHDEFGALQRLAVTDTHSETPPLPRPHPLGGVDPMQVARPS